MAHDSVSHDALAMVVALIHNAQQINAEMQAKTTQGSPEWHRHEDLDDKLHNALEHLGD